MVYINMEYDFESCKYKETIIVNIEDYIIEELQPGLFAIDDRKENSMYLVVGEKKALLIDTGIMEENIMPVIRSLTGKPIELALTHAHIDHMYHSEEFEKVFLHKDDIKEWKKRLRYVYWGGSKLFRVSNKRQYINKFIPITENSTFDLGGNTIKTIHVKGHTPGSCIFVDEKHKVLFMGDAVGSGIGEWLWLPGSSKLSDYRKSLKELISELELYRDYLFLGGHRLQAERNADKPYAYPFNISVVEDMYMLCNKILNKEVFPKKHRFLMFFRLYIFKYGTASIWESKLKIK